MYNFNVVHPVSVAEAVAAYDEAADPMYLSGGMTLVPSLKAHLAAPDLLIDLSQIFDLAGITDTGGALRIGAMTRMADIESSDLVRDQVPVLAKMAGLVADRHVRNKGTLGGSIANNDPAADFPAAVLGLGATIETCRREIACDDFFDGLYETVLEDGELLTAIHFPKTDKAAYAKHPHPASGYAVAGVLIAQVGDIWRVAVTGAGEDGVFRLLDLEHALTSEPKRSALPNEAFSDLPMIDTPDFPPDFRQAMVHQLAEAAWNEISP